MKGFKLGRTLVRSSLVTAAVASVAGPVAAATRVLELEGFISEAENLTFAVLNGNVLSQNPQPSDLPLAFTGELIVDTTTSFAQLSISGAFTSPTRSYAFDVVTPNIIDGLDVLKFGGVVQFTDAFEDIDLSLALSERTGFGSFEFRNIGAVPSAPSQDVFVSGTITDVLVVPAAPSAVLFAAGVTATVRRSRTSS